MRIRAQLDVRHLLKKKNQLGHNDSFCEVKMSLGVEVAVMGWYLSLRAQSKRALAINNIWLREDREDDKGESLITEHNLENRP